jgi:hypothetical protein
MGKKSGSGSGIWDEQPGSYFLELGNHFFCAKILKFFDADLGWRQFGSGIRDKHPGSAKLLGGQASVPSALFFLQPSMLLVSLEGPSGF